MATSPWLDQVKFGPDGLVTVVAQDARNGDVLMVAHANREALELTLQTGFAHYWSRSRQALWKKGETSGHLQQIAELRLDCDGDAILYRVAQTGAACHVGTRTCFSTVAGPEGAAITAPEPGAHLLTRLAALVHQRAVERPEGSYTVTLLDKGIAKISQKVGEEGVEVVVAANAESGERLASEAADLLYHLVVLLEARGVALDAVLGELEQRGR